jgi:hypothetical protein
MIRGAIEDAWKTPGLSAMAQAGGAVRGSIKRKTPALSRGLRKPLAYIRPSNFVARLTPDF